MPEEIREGHIPPVPSADVEQARQLLTHIFPCGDLCRLPPCQCINDVAAALTAARREGQALDAAVVGAARKVDVHIIAGYANGLQELRDALAARDAAKLNEVPRFCSETPPPLPPGGGRRQELRALDEGVVEAARAYCASYNSLGRLDSSLLRAMDRALAARDAAIMRTGG